MRGRKPKPTYLRVLDGNASHSQQTNPAEPIADRLLGDPPAEFDARHAKIWRETLANCPPGMLTTMDETIFRQWVSHRAVFDQAQAKHQELTGGGNLLDAEKYLALMNVQSRILRGLNSDLGFNPTARPRVKVDKQAAATRRGAGTFAKLKDSGE